MPAAAPARTVHLAARVEPELHAALASIAADQGVSVSAVVRVACWRHAERVDRERRVAAMSDEQLDAALAGVDAAGAARAA